jgi:hypothetical protein
LYADAQSIFIMWQCLPALSKTSNHLPVEDMVAGNKSLSMPSFTHPPLGAERLRIILAVPFGFNRHIMPLNLAFAGRQEGSNGPATIP